MSASQRTNWFWSDWLGDQAVRRLTPAERGVWIDLLALAAAASPVGYVCDDRGRPLTLDAIARVTNASSVDELAKLIAGILDKGAASRDRSGRLFNRRMVRDAELAAKKAALSAKRAVSGLNGAKATKLRYFTNPSLPQQVPRQLPGHLPRETLVNPFPKKDLTSTCAVAARGNEKPSPQQITAAKDATRQMLDEAFAKRRGLSTGSTESPLSDPKKGAA